MIDLDEELRRLADSLDLPATPVDDDLARGRAARRTRNLATVGASVVGAAMVVAGVAMLSGGTSNRAVEPAPAVGGTTSPSPSASVTPSHHAPKQHHLSASSAPADPFAPMSKHDVVVLRDALNGYHDVLAEHLDPNGTQLASFSNYQGGGNELGSKFDWSGGGMLQISVAAKLPHFWCCKAAGDYAMHDVPMAGVRSAKVGSDATSTAVIVEHQDGTGVFLVASSEFGNNGTSIAATGLTAQQLLDAAADPRLVLPDPLPGGEPGPGLFR